MHAIRQQVEYYLSDENLARDSFFRDLLTASPGGWLRAETSLLSCPKIQRMGVEAQELAAALQHSETLEVSGAAGTPCWVRRRRPYEDSTRRDQARWAPKGRDDTPAPYYDGSSPCGYFMAGHCRHGDRCRLQHSVPYALAIRHEWLHAGQAEARAELQAAAANALGHAAVAQARLFPRVFSQPFLGQAPPGSNCVARSAQSRRWSKGTEASTRSSPVMTDRSPSSSSPGSLRFLLVLDLEGKDEIIEFPVIILDVASRKEVGRFQHYVRPEHLFDGLEVQAESPAVLFPQVLEEFDVWLHATIGHSVSERWTDAAFLTCGDFDCKHIHRQCKISKIPAPPAFSHWVNIKRSYDSIYGGTFRGMKSMLAKLRLLDASGGVKFGFHHLGMHDVENICRCALHLLQEGHEISINGDIGVHRT